MMWSLKGSVAFGLFSWGMALFAAGGAGSVIPEAPRINGPRVYGVRPGSPIVFRVPVTGTRPMTFQAEGLPEGVTFDAAKGILGGAAACVTQSNPMPSSAT